MIVKEGRGMFEVISSNIPSKRQEVFYNPSRKWERDLNVTINNLVFKREYKALDALSASGVRGIRFLLETQCHFALLNDINPKAYSLIKRNLKLNGVGYKAIATNEDARRLYLNLYDEFDYVDVDPFGSPLQYVQNLCRILKRRAILGVTATDTGVLVGKYREKLLTEYLINSPGKLSFKYEFRVRNLISVIVRELSKQDCMAIPIFALHDRHYYRVYFEIFKKPGRKRLYEFLSENLGWVWEFGFSNAPVENASGPTYVGKLWKEDLLYSLLSSEFRDLAEKALEDAKVNLPYYYEIPEIASKFKVKRIKPMEKIIEELREIGYAASRSFFSPTGIKTYASLETLIEIISAG